MRLVLSSPVILSGGAASRMRSSSVVEEPALSEAEGIPNRNSILQPRKEFQPPARFVLAIPTLELTHTLITFAAPPPCLSLPRQKTTLEIVKRFYTIARVKGGMKFTCSHCAHHVSTLDFDARDGNLRTQAATAINRHATTVHHEPVMFTSLDVQQRIWRG